MPQSIVVRGHVVGSTTVELEKPVPDAEHEVDVILRVQDELRSPARLADFLRQLPPGTRSKEDIDRQLREERDSWD